MNQILDYNPNKSSGGGSSGSDKIVRVFAIILAIFAICLLAGGAYGLYQNNIKKEVVTEAPTKAKIEIQQKESTAIISVSHDKIIDKLIYSWDSGKEVVIKGNGESTMETEISLLAGDHVLAIKVVDIDGVESTHEESLVSEEGTDQVFPVIDYSVTTEKKLKITATDETEISYVTYRWNDEEEVRVDVSDEDNKKIEFEIDIRKGKNDIVIVAVDANNNSSNKQESFTGVTKPEIKITISPDKKSIDVYAFHEKGIKEIQLLINDQNFDVDIGDQNPTEVSFNVALEAEKNTVKLVAISVDDTKTEYTEEIVAEIENETNEDEIQISIEQKEETPEVAAVKVICEQGIKELKLNVNDVDYDVDIGNEGPTEAAFDLPLVEGNNKITLTAISVNGTEKQEIKEITR